MSNSAAGLASASAFGVALWLGAACSSPEPSDGDGVPSGDGGLAMGAQPAGAGSGGVDTGSGFGGNLDLPGGGGTSGASSAGGADSVCESTSSEAALVPVFLAFALDVSGSMGKIEDSACFDPAFKWGPLVQAATAFFESPDAVGLHASMVLFPENDDVCDSPSYEEPDVTMQQLPSTAFRTALSAYDEEVADEGWRGNTPTLAAFEGTLASLTRAPDDGDSAELAVVLVTDGLPQGCGNEDEIEGITTAVQEAAEAGISTYVIGVQQPTSKEGCDADEDNLGLVDNLNQIAVAGATRSPFMIDTGDPQATQAALDAAILAIRSRSVSCELEIPEPPTGGTFDKDKTNVSVVVEGLTTGLTYDPQCGPEGGWRYDDPESPTRIELCPASCDEVTTTVGIGLNVDFLCEPRPDVIR